LSAGGSDRERSSVPDVDPPVFDTLETPAGGDADPECLFQRHYGGILRATVVRLGIPIASGCVDIEAAVDDAFLETFEKLRHGGIAGIQTTGAFRRHVTRIAANRVIDQQRRRAAAMRGGGRVRSLSSVSGDASDYFVGPIDRAHSNGFEQVTGADLEERVGRALVELQEPYQKAIELSYLWGMSATQIADTGELCSRCGGHHIRNAAHVRLVLHRARRQLGALLGINPEGG